MNYYDAKQRKEDGRWDYTCNDHPTGYCRAYKEPNLEKEPYWSEHEIAKYKDNKEKYHSNGHATEEEARECYRQWILDNELRFWEANDTQRKCKVCGAWTSNVAEVDCKIFTLCDEHNNRKTVEQLLETPGQIWSSW
jgi:hypothetical protein